MSDKTCILTEREAYSIAELIDSSLFVNIRNDTDIDSMMWLISVIHGYEKMCKCSGYVGLTESKIDKDGDCKK